MPCWITCAMLCCATLRYVTLCYVMLCFFMLCYVMLCYAMLCYAMLCYAMLCYAMLCYVMLCYAMLCYGWFFFLTEWMLRSKSFNLRPEIQWSVVSHAQSSHIHMGLFQLTVQANGYRALGRGKAYRPPHPLLLLFLPFTLPLGNLCEEEYQVNDVLTHRSNWQKFKSGQ